MINRSLAGFEDAIAAKLYVWVKMYAWPGIYEAELVWAKINSSDKGSVLTTDISLVHSIMNVHQV